MTNFEKVSGFHIRGKLTNQVYPTGRYPPMPHKNASQIEATRGRCKSSCFSSNVHQGWLPQDIKFINITSGQVIIFHQPKN